MSDQLAVSDRVKAACEREWPAHKGDCSAFVRAVGLRFQVLLMGEADEIVTTLRAGASWRRLANGIVARDSARAGKLVLAGLRGDEQAHPSAHGHVAVIVDGPLAHNQYPTGYWGSLAGSAAKDQTINWTWTAQDRDRVTYAEHALA